MTALIAWLLANPTVLAIIAGIVGALGFGLQQRRAGAKSERNRQAAREAKARDIHDEIQSDVGSMSADHIRAELGERATDK